MKREKKIEYCIREIRRAGGRTRKQLIEKYGEEVVKAAEIIFQTT